MPTYEYACMKCNERLEVYASIAEKEKGLKVMCPACGSNKMVQIFRSLNILGSSRGLDGPPRGCGPMSGPSCCG